MASYAAGLDVLDLGCCGYPSDSDTPPTDNLETAVRPVARTYLGADITRTPEASGHTDSSILELDVSEGASAAEMLGGRTFDLVLAGELLEHLGSPLGLFELVRALMRPNGTFVLSTPNPYAPHRTYHGLRNHTWESADHVFYAFPSGLVELGDRAGLALASWTTVGWVDRGDRLAESISGLARRLRGQPIGALPVTYVPLLQLLPLLRRWDHRPIGETLVFRFRIAERAD